MLISLIEFCTHAHTLTDDANLESVDLQLLLFDESHFSEELTNVFTLITLQL